MYLQLTNRCNMSCAHCCMSSGPRAHKKDLDMSHEVFLAAASLAHRCGSDIVIGGGEPLLHDYFFDFLDKVIRMDFFKNNGIHPLIVTNGKHKGRTWRLISQYLDLDYPIWVELSTDAYHDPIDPDIRDYFMRRETMRQEASRQSYLGRSVESASAGTRDSADRHVLAVGRGINLAGARQGCACEDMMVDAAGFVYSCGCKHTRIGHVIMDTNFTQWYSSDHAHQGGRDPCA